MRRFILSAVMIVTALTFTLDANAQNEKKEVMQKKTERTTKLAKRGDVCKKADGKCPKAKAEAEKKECCKDKAMKAEDAKSCCKKEAAVAEKNCGGCKKADGKCPKAKAEAEKK